MNANTTLFLEMRPLLLSLLDAINAYIERGQFEPIVKGEHPIHVAMVDCEEFCRQNDPRCQKNWQKSGNGSWRFQRVFNCWVEMLWASRAGDVEACKERTLKLRELWLIPMLENGFPDFESVKELWSDHVQVDRKWHAMASTPSTPSPTA